VVGCATAEQGDIAKDVREDDEDEGEEPREDPGRRSLDDLEELGGDAAKQGASVTAGRRSESGNGGAAKEVVEEIGNLGMSFLNDKRRGTGG